MSDTHITTDPIEHVMIGLATIVALLILVVAMLDPAALKTPASAPMPGNCWHAPMKVLTQEQCNTQFPFAQR